MFRILLIMFVGVAVGYLIRSWSALKHINLTTMITILLLLFVMGVEVGQNEGLISNLRQLGSEALLIALATVTGSIISARILYLTVFKRSEDGK